MKKLCLGFATLLLGSTITYGHDADMPAYNFIDSTSQMMVTSDNLPTLTPRGSTPTVARAQDAVSPAIPPAPTLNNDPLRVATATTMSSSFEPVNTRNGVQDSFFQSELERLSNSIEELQRRTAPPDTRRAWSAPRVGGRIFLNSVNIMNQNAESKSGNGNMQNGAGFRELRLGASGTGFEAFDYRVEFAYHSRDGRVTLTDNWVGARNIPLLGYFRVGHFRPETGQYYTMGSQNVTTLEYPTAANIFGLGRRVGVSSEHLLLDDKVRFFFGLYQSEATDLHRYSARDNQGQTVNIRLTTTPVMENDGKYLLHFGGHWAHVGAFGNGVHGAGRSTNLRATPGTFTFDLPASLQTGAFANTYSNRGGVEVALQNGRFSARSEYFVGSFGAYDGHPSRKIHGTYVELGYFLTDSFRVYSPASGLFTGVRMNDNFRPFKHGGRNFIDGTGAWQTVFQWSYVDMTDWRADDNLGGYQNDFAVGMNWFWTPQLCWMFQYVHSRQCVGSSNSHRSQDIFATSLRATF